MILGYIGLGKMGYNMVERLVEKGHEVFAFDQDEAARNRAENLFTGTNLTSGVKNSLMEVIRTLAPPRIIWLMVPHQVVDHVLGEITNHLERGDTIVDGGNSLYKDSINRAEKLDSSGIHFLDVGVSGGPDGARKGACLMIGGYREDYNKLESLFRDLAAEDAYGYMGKHGAGHFVKMVHNGIEYGMMQALAEGFSVLKQAEFDLDLQKVAALYNHKSVVESRLVGWLKDAFEEFGQDMESVSGAVGASGEGAWTVEAAHEFGVRVSVIEDALKFREESKNNPSYAGKLLSAMRNRFGGHTALTK